MKRKEQSRAVAEVILVVCVLGKNRAVTTVLFFFSLCTQEQSSGS